MKKTAGLGILIARRRQHPHFRSRKERRNVKTTSENGSLFSGPTGFGQLLDAPARERPRHLALVSGKARLTYGELAEQVDRLAAALERDGIRPGDAVAIISRNCAEYIIIELALFRLGAVSVKINWRFLPEEIEALLALNHVRWAFVRYEGAARPQGGPSGAGVRLIALNRVGGAPSAFEEYLAAAPPAAAFTPRQIAPEAPLVRIHTSGTTGRPKCVMLTHGDFMREVSSCVEALQFTPDTVHQMVNQMFHIACVSAYINLALGATLVLLPRFEERAYLESLERERVTSISVLPLVLKRLLDHPSLGQYDLSRLKRINYSTCPMPPALLQRALAVFGASCRFYQSYGMTEMCSVVTVLDAEDHRQAGSPRLASVGRPIPGVQLRIRREDGTDARPGECGEVLLRGPGQMQGYYRGTPAPDGEALRDGWYHTKDMGYLDEQGYLYICGRKDDLIISGGENIYPKEIVDVLMRLTDDIAEAAVYGIPDPAWGERVVACVILLPASRLTGEALRNFCRANMPHYKVPKQFVFLQELPKGATGKVLLPELKRWTMEQCGKNGSPAPG